MSRRPCSGGFGLLRTGFPVETSAATVVWQQSTNTRLSTCIVSRMETQTVKMPTWDNGSVSSQVSWGLHAGARLPPSCAGASERFRLLRSTSCIVQYFPETMNRPRGSEDCVPCPRCVCLCERRFHYRSTVLYKGRSDATKRTTRSGVVYVDDGRHGSLNTTPKTVSRCEVHFLIITKITQVSINISLEINTGIFSEHVIFGWFLLG